MTLHGKEPTMSQTQPRAGFYAWDEQDARSIASNTPSYEGALFAAYPAAEPALPPRRRAPGPRFGRLSLSTRLKVLVRLRRRLVRIGG